MGRKLVIFGNASVAQRICFLGWSPEMGESAPQEGTRSRQDQRSNSKPLPSTLSTMRK